MVSNQKRGWIGYLRPNLQYDIGQRPEDSRGIPTSNLNHEAHQSRDAGLRVSCLAAQRVLTPRLALQLAQGAIRRRKQKSITLSMAATGNRTLRANLVPEPFIGVPARRSKLLYLSMQCYRHTSLMSIPAEIIAR